MSFSLKIASPNCKKTVPRLQILPQLFKSLQSLVDTLRIPKTGLHSCPNYKSNIRSCTKLSYTLIFLPPTHKSLGFTRIFDTCQYLKWGSLQQAIALGASPLVAANALLTHAFFPHQLPPLCMPPVISLGALLFVSRCPKKSHGRSLESSLRPEMTSLHLASEKSYYLIL